MSVIQVGLTDTTRSIDKGLLQTAAAAINIQVMRDLPQFWNIDATVRYLPDSKSIPVGVWPVFLKSKLPPDEGGVHLDKKNQLTERRLPHCLLGVVQANCQAHVRQGPTLKLGDA
jgi:hypothetical protein